MARSVTVHLYTICWDEADMLPFFFRHYDPWVDRYVVYDDGSTDGSLELLAAHPKVELRRFERSVEGSFVLSHTRLQNSVWKESRGTADWVVVTALDEHLFVPGKDMRRYLADQRERGTTIVPALGFDTISETLPEAGTRLVDEARLAVPEMRFNKLSIFDPSAIERPRFSPGRHLARPQGRVRRPQMTELVLFHFKNLGYEQTRARQRAEGMRLGEGDRAKQFGAHYLASDQSFRKTWDERMSRAIRVSAGVSPAALAQGPFWWTVSGRMVLLARKLRRMISDRMRRAG
jgi:hypothetical protein